MVQVTLAGVILTPVAMIAAAIITRPSPAAVSTSSPEKPKNDFTALGSVSVPIFGWGRWPSSPTFDRRYDGEREIFLPVWVREGTIVSATAAITRKLDNQIQPPPELSVVPGGLSCRPTVALDPEIYSISVTLKILPKGGSVPIEMETALNGEINIHWRISSSFVLSVSGFKENKTRWFADPLWEPVKSQQQYPYYPPSHLVPGNWLFEYFVAKSEGTRFALLANGVKVIIDPTCGKTTAAFMDNQGPDSSRELKPLQGENPWFMWRSLAGKSYGVFFVTTGWKDGPDILVVGVQTKAGPKIIGKFRLPHLLSRDRPEIGFIPLDNMEFGGFALGTYYTDLLHASYVDR